jgi:phage shock protein PspC (stress-responsive transcriptional regulator)
MKIALTIPGYGQVDSGAPGGVPTGGLFGTGANIVRVIVIFLVLAAIFVALYYILIAGLNLITSRGHKENIKNNREALVYAVLGLFFIFMSFFFINLLGNFAGFNLISIFFSR